MNSGTFRRGRRYGVLGNGPLKGTPEAELWDSNQVESPLLRLPPEIRNRIYELLLANLRIHVMHTPSTKKSVITCHAPCKDTSRQIVVSSKENKENGRNKPADHVVTRGGGFHSLILRRRANPFATTPMKPSHVISRGVTLLSLVCRQLYHETDLIPYATGTWSFSSPAVMERYLMLERRLPVLQRRAVRKLAVKGIRGNGTLSRKMRGFLGGLEVIWFWDAGKGWVKERIFDGVEEIEVGTGRPN